MAERVLRFPARDREQLFRNLSRLVLVAADGVDTRKVLQLSGAGQRVLGDRLDLDGPLGEFAVEFVERRAVVGGRFFGAPGQSMCLGDVQGYRRVLVDGDGRCAGSLDRRDRLIEMAEEHVMPPVTRQDGIGVVGRDLAEGRLRPAFVAVSVTVQLG